MKNNHYHYITSTCMNSFIPTLNQIIPVVMWSHVYTVVTTVPVPVYYTSIGSGLRPIVTNLLYETEYCFIQ